MILEGKPVAESIYQSIQEKLAGYNEKPGIAFILVGEDAPSLAYVRMKQKKCSELGFYSVVKHFEANVSEQDLIQYIHKCNEDPSLHGILVQQPLPKHLTIQTILSSVDPKKDVDGFHPMNIGQMVMGEESPHIPCTPRGIMKMLSYYNIPTEGKHVVVVGRSLIVGRPLSILLSQKSPSANATVTLCHSRTPDIQQHTLKADILIVAAGQASMITQDMVSNKCVVIDVGINRVGTKDSYTLKGDVDFENVSKVCTGITPVPGGVGPLTIAMLMQNTFLSFLAFQKN